MALAPDPADRSTLDAQADGGFQSAGTRFPDGIERAVQWMERGGVLTSHECVRVAAYIRALQQRGVAPEPSRDVCGC